MNHARFKTRRHYDNSFKGLGLAGNLSVLEIGGPLQGKSVGGWVVCLLTRIRETHFIRWVSRQNVNNLDSRT